MSERTFRLLQGIYLFIALFLDNATMMYGIIFMYLFEGITNWRVPILVSRLRYGVVQVYDPFQLKNARIPCDSERIQRLFAAFFLYAFFFVFPDETWFGPWFLAVIFTMAGLTNICPSVMFFRYLGFR